MNLLIGRSDKIQGVLYQVIACASCLYLAADSHAATETLCFYLLPAITASALTLNGGFLYVFLGIIFFIFYDDKKKMVLVSSIYAIGISLIQSLSVIPYILYKIRVLLPFAGELVSEAFEVFVSTILGLAPMNSGGDMFTVQYQWLMALACLLIFLYNEKRGKSLKYLFYFMYPLHIVVLWMLSRSIG